MRPVGLNSNCPSKNIFVEVSQRKIGYEIFVMRPCATIGMDGDTTAISKGTKKPVAKPAGFAIHWR